MRASRKFPDLSLASSWRALSLCLLSTIGTAAQEYYPDKEHQSPTQNVPANSEARQAEYAPQRAGDALFDQSPCIVDLKPGDVRLFAPSTPGHGKLYRWLDLQTASLGTLYLFVKNGAGVRLANQQQYQVAVRGRFKFDGQGRLAIHAGVYTGASFIAGSNNTGLGVGKPRSNLFLKHLYLSALPIRGVEVQYGGLDVWHDESTDITGYAYNGYIVGERVSVKRSREFFFDEISIAYSYAGDLNVPNVFSRLHRVTQGNFHRFLLKKNIGERAWMSADYTFEAGVPTWREAFRIRATEFRVIDTFHAEVYEVSRLRSGFGLAAYGEKAVYPKFTVGGGYADVDRAILNSDRYGRGNRLFVTARIPPNEAFSILIFATQATDHAAANLPQQRLDVGLYYNVLSLLRKTHSSERRREFGEV